MSHVVVGPWMVLHRARQAGRPGWQDLRELWEGSAHGTGGPMEAARAALGRAGVTGSIDRWASRGRVLADPLSTPVATWRGFLLAALEDAQLEFLTRRTDFKGVRSGLDNWASGIAAKRLSLAPDAAGALRAVRVGGVIQDRTVQRWGRDAQLCPHCQLVADTAFHRFWECPVLSEARSGQLRGLTLAEVRAETPDLTLLTGLIPVDIRLLDARDRAEAHPVAVVQPVPGFPETVFTDGAGSDGEDPWLRRATWGVAWEDEGGVWRSASGPTPGRQTVPRSELYAAYWASEAGGPVLTIVTDNRYVHDGLVALRSGRARKYLEGLDGDLWTRFLGKRIPDVRWVPSHKPLPVFLARGFLEGDWYGNKRADRAAGLALESRRVSETVLDRQARRLKVLTAAVGIIAGVQLAHLKIRHAVGSEIVA